MAKLEPTPRAIREELGLGSRAHALARERLTELLGQHRGDPVVARKRSVWAERLRACSGSSFVDDDELFVAHGLLVAAALLVAHTLLDIDGATIDPAELFAGQALAQRGIEGVGETEVFDWLGSLPGASACLRPLAHAIARFEWAHVEHDLLKVLHHSLVAADLRKQLGEFYTPDWLAEAIVDEVIDAPHEQRVLDPSCGSGTFLFHALRRMLAANQPEPAAIAELVGRVRGIDLHPVAVALAKVTYLLALGRERLVHPERESFAPPVRLADAMTSAPEPVDLLIGNPPWLAYRYMDATQQASFRAQSEARGLWRGASQATHQDLSALFVARVVCSHLEVGGRFAFVMPNAALDRAQFAGFRSGELGGARVAFTRPWDLRRLRPHFFPRAAAVVFGARAATSEAMPTQAERWIGRVPADVDAWSRAESTLERAPAPLVLADEASSAYRARFRQGATIVPRVLFLVERQPPSSSVPAGCSAVCSLRSANEKLPWKSLPSLAGVVEDVGLRPVYLGEHVLPHRLLPAATALLPDLDAELPPGLAAWWREAERLWNAHRTSERLSLADQLDYHGKLRAQSPAGPLRVVYPKSGMHVCAAIIADPLARIDHSLYWADVATIDEAHYLCGVLNSTTLTARARPIMSYGKDERDIHKHLWNLPIPTFDSERPELVEIAELAASIADDVRALALEGFIGPSGPKGSIHFAARRRQIRTYLEAHPLAQRLEDAVANVLDSPTESSA